MKLELKHLAPYLPHRLNMKFVDDDENETAELTGLMDMGKPHVQVKFGGNNGMFLYKELKPILHSISDLTEEHIPDIITRNTILFAWESAKLAHNSNELLIDMIRYNDIQVLLENHFDVFELIAEGLAIDINTLDI